MFGQCPIFAQLGLRSILLLCEQRKINEYGVLAEYLQIKSPLEQIFQRAFNLYCLNES